MMDWTMHDETVKVQLFRFIDALPQLQTSESVTTFTSIFTRRATTCRIGPGSACASFRARVGSPAC